MPDGTTRHMRPVDDEPPYDPAYDTPTSRGRPAIADRDAELALLTVLLRYPDSGHLLDDELDPDDFYWPIHQQIWTTWHTLAADGVPPDAVLLNNQLIAGKHADAVHLVTTLAAGETTADPLRAPGYAKTIRDHARRRAFHDTFTQGLDLVDNPAASNGRLDTYLGEALQTLDNAINRYGASTGPATSTGAVDMSWILTGDGPPRQPEPVYVRRTDGTALFYPGQVNGVFGDPEHGKTWLAQLAIVQALNTGGTAAMIDVDHNGPDASAARLLLLGAQPQHLADPDRFTYYEPQDPEQLLNACNQVTARRDQVLLLDSIGEVFGLLGVNPNDEIEVTKAMRATCTRPAMAGTCVITVDHLPKSHEARATGFAIGSIAKKRMIRGAYLRVDAKQKPVPGGIGRITIRIEKDTMGELRRSSGGGGYVGELVLDSTHDYALEWDIRRATVPTNDDGTLRPTTLMERIAKYIADHDGCTQRDVEADVPGTGKYIRQALQVLVAEGHVSRVAGPRRAWFHHLEIPYLEAEDDHAS